MVAAIFFGFLFIIVLSFILVFIFYILSPALKRQSIPFERSLIPEGEINLKPAEEEIHYSNANGNRAVVLCSPDKECSSMRFKYKGPESCALFFSIFDTEHDCKWNCAGFGDCMKACSRYAISIENGTAVVNSLCNGCGDCLDSCPKKIIKLIPGETKSVVLCNAPLSKKIDCSAYLSESENTLKEKRCFQLWKKFYTILNKGK